MHLYIGPTFLIETDHKPLVPLLTTKFLDSLPPRLICFRLRLACFSYTVQHVPGKLLYTADALSRAPTVPSPNSVIEEVEEFVSSSVIAALPASANWLRIYSQAQKQDLTYEQIREFCITEWPSKERISHELKPYWNIRGSFTLCEDLLLFNSRIVVPKVLQRKTLDKIHQGHQGIERCLLCIKYSVRWPGITSQLKQLIQNCGTCCKNARPRREFLLTTPLPEYPWQRIATDLFELHIVVDYFSRYPEISKLTTTTSTAVIVTMKAVFARHGIPEIVRSDNGPQYSSHEFTLFADSYGFQHSTSSTHYPQSNGRYHSYSLFTLRIPFHLRG